MFGPAFWNGVMQQGGAIAMFALVGFFGYLIYKLYLKNRDKKIEKAAADEPRPATVPPPLPVLGGTNPAGAEHSGVVLTPEKQPVTNEVCMERQRVVTTKLDTVGEQIEKLDNNLSDTNRSINKALLKMTEQVTETKTCVAVLKDRANRGG